MKKISVIIPVYNVEEYLARCLESFIGQPYKNFELILINDGSTDNSAQICDEYSKKDSRIIVVHKNNEGVCVARNKGIELATGDYITFVDSDDWVNENFTKVCEILNNIDTDLAIVPLNVTNLETTDFEINKENFSHLINSKDLSISTVWSKFFKKEIVKKEQFLKDVKIAEDKEYVCRILFNSKHVKIIDEPFYQFFVREGSVMNSNRDIVLEKLILSTKKIISFINEYNYPDDYKDELLNLFSTNLFWGFNAYAEAEKQDRKKLKKLIKENLHLFKHTKSKRKKILLLFIKIFGISFAVTSARLFRKR